MLSAFFHDVNKLKTNPKEKRMSEKLYFYILFWL